MTTKPESDRPEAAPRLLRVVDISAMLVSADPQDTLVTYSLGSCVGVAVYDPEVRVGGLMHCMLPLSRLDPDKARLMPCMFVDTGMAVFLQQLFDHGVRKSRAVVKVVGASRILDHRHLFRIGERNYAVVRRMLWKNDILMAAEDVGGEVTRTVSLEIATGQVWVKSGGRTRRL